MAGAGQSLNIGFAMVWKVLIIGLNNYRHGSAGMQLQAPAYDAARIAQRLEAEGFWAVDRLPLGRTKGGRDMVSHRDDAFVTVRDLEAAIENLFYPPGN